MTARDLLVRLTQREGLNFILTNRIPRRTLTRFLGWFSKVEHPLVRDASIAVWRVFCDVDLSDAREQSFKSMHDCFTRELREGARPIDSDPSILVSPCDAIVGACGEIHEGQLIQAKGFAYPLNELTGTAADLATYRCGTFITLRLTAGMYHRFHAPHDLRVHTVRYMSGDVWNVNPVALRRVEKLYCENERAVVRAILGDGSPLTLVAVGAVLVSSIRLNFLDVRLPEQAGITLPCNAAFGKGAEMGWFEHGSTIIVIAPRGFRLMPNVREGERIRMGEPLLLRANPD